MESLTPRMEDYRGLRGFAEFHLTIYDARFRLRIL